MNDIKSLLLLIVSQEMVSKIFNFLVQIITLGSISSVLGTNDTLGSRCRCLYADPSCWPSDADFASLASQLSQSLIYPVPPESACYPPSNPSGNCTQVLLNTFNGTWRSDQPGSMQAPNFETFIFTNDSISACYLNTTLGVPCEQGNVPPIGVDARTPGDIQTAVVFAKKWNLQVVIKSTGHDFLGRSSGRGSFMIWTHNMKNITYNPTFIPEGGLSNETYNALTLGAGVQWQEAYEAAELHGRFLIGGIAPGGSVGAAGGWILGGGHSVLSPQYGLGVDNVLEFTIVTSSGSHLTVNAYSDPDLFWALRGGGGGTYGVLTSVTYNTHPTEPVVLVVLEALNITSPNTTQSIVSEFVHFSPNLTDLGWGGYSYITPQTFQFFGVSPNTSWADTNATIKPLFDFVGSATGGNVVATTIPFDSFYTLYTTVFSPSSGEGNSIGQNVEIISRLLPRDLVETNYEKVAETLVGANNLVAYQ
jgi:hypothetical protein